MMYSKPKKSYGQHFLVSQGIIDRIIIAIKEHSADIDVLEVGPGRGALTQYLIGTQGYRAVEADRDMKAHLDKAYPEHTDKVILEDFMKYYIRKEVTAQTALVGNFPYNISSQIVFRLLEHVDLFPVMIGMFQKEVSDRLLSSPHSKVYGILSVLVAHFYTGRTVTRVAPGSFQPPPRVQSSVILLQRKDDWEEQVALYKPLRTVVKMAFHQRRKMLRRSLESLFTTEQLAEHGLDDKRPEQLDLEEFRLLARMLG